MKQVDAEEAIKARTKGWKQFEKEWKKYEATCARNILNNFCAHGFLRKPIIDRNCRNLHNNQVSEF